MDDLASRLANRVQLTTDGHRVYLQAVEDAFGGNVDYAMLVKMYGEDSESEKRYSPPECIGCQRVGIVGRPQEELVSTSHVERQKPHHADADAAIYPTRKRILKEARQPESRYRSAFRVVQLRAHSPNPSDRPGSRGWPDRSRLDAERTSFNYHGLGGFIFLQVVGPNSKPTVPCTHLSAAVPVYQLFSISR